MTILPRSLVETITGFPIIRNFLHFATGFKAAQNISSDSVKKDFFVCNKVKGGISKRRKQENKARQIFWKTNISYPQIGTHLEIHPFAILPRFCGADNHYTTAPCEFHFQYKKYLAKKVSSLQKNIIFLFIPDDRNFKKKSKHA